MVVHSLIQWMKQDAPDTSRTQWTKAEPQRTLLESRFLAARAFHHGAKDDDDDQDTGGTAGSVL